MASSLVMSLIGAAGLAAALLVGCGDNDAKPVPSKAGQSCARTADCADGLSCIANVCYSSSSAGGSGGSGGAATVGPVLGGEGESCTSRKDCQTDLACFNQRCTQGDVVGAGGDTGSAPTAQLGARGETCRVNADCAKDLICVPGSTTTTAGVGVCDVANYGITPTGKYCGGECGVASDCCQLPQIKQTAYNIKSCPDLAALITADAVDCTMAQTAGTLGDQLCFLDATYCTGCTAATWKCTDSACVYNAACTVAAGADSDTGCPSYTRLGIGVPTCNAKTLKCTGTATCTDDKSCIGLPVADASLASPDTCSDGECVCYAGDHQCYRACARDVDCATGKVCDKKSALCVPDTVCTTNADCAERFGSVSYQCQTDGTCALTCATDHDCSASGRIVNGSRVDTFTSAVCVAGLCTSVAGDCTDDSQCGTTNGYKTFCIDRPAASTDAAVSSAITN